MIETSHSYTIPNSQSCQNLIIKVEKHKHLTFIDDSAPSAIRSRYPMGKGLVPTTAKTLRAVNCKYSLSHNVKKTSDIKLQIGIVLQPGSRHLQ